MIAGDMLLLQQSPYFWNFRPEELALVQRHARRRDLAAGEIILLEGQPAEALYMVRRGRVRIFRSTVEGREQVLFVVRPGATFDDASAFDGGTNLANAQAIDPGASICVLPAALLRQLLATNPLMAANVTRMLASRVRQLADLVEDLSLRHITQRVANLLAEERATNGTVVVSREEIAARVGSVREVVSRTLRHLEEAGAVRRHGSHVLEVDTQMLRAIVAAEPAIGVRHIAVR